MVLMQGLCTDFGRSSSSQALGLPKSVIHEVDARPEATRVTKTRAHRILPRASAHGSQ